MWLLSTEFAKRVQQLDSFATVREMEQDTFEECESLSFSSHKIGIPMSSEQHTFDTEFK